MPEESKCINMQILHGDPRGAGSGCLNSTSPLSTSSLRFMQVSVILVCEGLKVRLLLSAPAEVSPPRLRLRPDRAGLLVPVRHFVSRSPPARDAGLPRLPPREEQKPSAQPPVVSLTFLISRLLSLPSTFYLLLSSLPPPPNTCKPPRRELTLSLISPAHSSSAATGSLIRKG